MTAWRLHPPDRRTPVAVPAGQCPLGRGCRCDGPPQDRMCRLPFPARIEPCPERDYRDQGDKPGATPSARCCFECGRVTSRIYSGRDIPWLDVDVPWCGGLYPEPTTNRRTPCQP